jgi:CheY-like chemotaxis protein
MYDAAVPRLLIVDDSEDLLEVQRELFTRKGFVVETAVDGAVALERVQTFKPDVVLLDMMMPVVDGLEFLARLGAPRPRVIATSGFGGCRDEALRRGAHVFLRKPVDIGVLLTAVITAGQLPAADVAENERHVDDSRKRSQQAARAIVDKLTEQAAQRVHGQLRTLVEWLQRYYGFGQCFLHLIHGDDVYLEACAGTDPQYLAEGMTYPRKNIYCDDVIDAGSTLYISDPLRHPVRTFSHHNEVRNRGWHFYIGAPLATADGAVLGTLCLMDRIPRTLYPEDVRLFEVLAQRVAVMLVDAVADRPLQQPIVDEERVFHADILELLVTVALHRVARERGKLHLVRIHVDDTESTASVMRKIYGVTSGMRCAVSSADGDYVVIHDGASAAIVDNNIDALQRMIQGAATIVATVTWFPPEGESDPRANATRLLATIGIGSS